MTPTREEPNDPTIEEKGELRSYSLMPKRVMHVALISYDFGNYYNVYSNEDKQDLLKLIHNTPGVKSVKIYQIPIED